ncbi:MAG: alginate export family protein [Bacteroidales bacterium]|nr:alginate export family protein [Bacteroidales bacterium]
MKKLVVLSLLLFSLMPESIGQFTLLGEFRPRFEYRGGYGKILSIDEEPVLTVSQRTRLSAYYQTGIFSFGFGIQDVRVWGDDDMYGATGAMGSYASIDLNEGWIGIKPYEKGLIKIGRQYWIYEDERILSRRGWNQSEIKYDAFLFKHSGETFRIDLGLSWNNMQEITFGNKYPSGKMKTLNFLYLKWNINDWLYLSGTGIASGYTATDTTSEINMQGTYGVYVGAKKGNFNALASGYYQKGKNRKGTNTSAYMFAVKSDYLFAGKYKIGVGIDYLSGTDQLATGPDYASKNHSFDNLYGTRHGFFGHLDYFNNLSKSTNNGGMVDIFLKFNWMFVPNANLGLDLHTFSLQNDVIDNTTEDFTALSRQLGQEFDFYISWDIIKYVNIRGGYSLFLATDTMEKLQGVYGNARFPSWAWIMITAKPVLFESPGR